MYFSIDFRDLRKFDIEIKIIRDNDYSNAYIKIHIFLKLMQILSSDITYTHTRRVSFNSSMQIYSYSLVSTFLYDAQHNANWLIATRYRPVYLLTLLFNPRESIKHI